MAQSRKDTKIVIADNDPFLYPRGGLRTTRQYLEFWAERTEKHQHAVEQVHLQHQSYSLSNTTKK